MDLGALLMLAAAVMLFWCHRSHRNVERERDALKQALIALYEKRGHFVKNPDGSVGVNWRQLK